MICIIICEKINEVYMKNKYIEISKKLKVLSDPKRLEIIDMFFPSLRLITKSASSNLFISLDSVGCVISNFSNISQAQSSSQDNISILKERGRETMIKNKNNGINVFQKYLQFAFYLKQIGL